MTREIPMAKSERAAALPLRPLVWLPPCLQRNAQNRSTKLQTPSSREAPNLKLQPGGDSALSRSFVSPPPGAFWNLELGASLELRAWCLELLRTVFHSKQRRTSVWLFLSLFLTILACCLAAAPS